MCTPGNSVRLSVLMISPPPPPFFLAGLLQQQMRATTDSRPPSVCARRRKWTAYCTSPTRDLGLVNACFVVLFLAIVLVRCRFLTHACSQVPEILFTPSDIGLGEQGIGECILNAIAACPPGKKKKRKKKKEGE